MKPVAYTPASQAIVTAYEALPKDKQTGAYWSDAAIKPVKKEIKDHYISEQSRRCAYCRQPMHTDNNGVWDAEHVISKTKNPEFMFVPRNLAISCKDCNLAKSEEEVRRVKKVAFPDTSEEYRIVHPHFDDYDQHIGWVGPLCFAKTTGKGTATINMCNLSRYAAMRIGEIENINDNRFNALVATLMGAKSPGDGAIVLAGIEAFFKAKP